MIPNPRAGAAILMDFLVGPSENQVTDPHALMDQVVTSLLYEILGPVAGAYLARVIDGPLVTHARICGPTLFALLHGEALEEDKVLEVYVEGLVIAALRSDVRAFPGAALVFFMPEPGEVHVRVQGSQSAVRFISATNVADPFLAGPAYLATGLVKLPSGWFAEAVGAAAFAARAVGIPSTTHPIVAAMHREAGYTVHIFGDEVFG